MGRTISDRMVCVENDVGILKHDIYDNGGIGLKTRVEVSEDFIQRAKGALALIGFVGISNIVVIVLFIIKVTK